VNRYRKVEVTAYVRVDQTAEDDHTDQETAYKAVSEALLLAARECHRPGSRFIGMSYPLVSFCLHSEPCDEVVVL
jgi:hypothetical protein